MASDDALLSMGLSPTEGTDLWHRSGEYPLKATLQEEVNKTSPELANYESFWRKTAQPSQQSSEVFGWPSCQL